MGVRPGEDGEQELPQGKGVLCEVGGLTGGGLTGVTTGEGGAM